MLNIFLMTAIRRSSVFGLFLYFVLIISISTMIACSPGFLFSNVPQKNDLLCENGVINFLKKNKMNLNDIASIENEDGDLVDYKVNMIGGFFNGRLGSKIFYCYSRNIFVAGAPFSLKRKILYAQSSTGSSASYEELRSMLMRNVESQRRGFLWGFLFFVLSAFVILSFGLKEYMEIKKNAANS